MKILKLRLANLNSLQGEHTLNFTQAPFTEAGLFAITGDTGAGKTTLLDAMTLALYGQVARQCEPKEVVTYGMEEAYAEVEFSCNEQSYRATWQAKRKKRGKYRGLVDTPTRQLAQLVDDETAHIIAEKKTEIEQQVEQLSGLDYHRFLRSVLLAQGDFAAFLKADAKDRAVLLERITGAEIYSELSKAAFQQEKNQRHLLENLASELNAHTLLTESETARLQSELSHIRSEQLSITQQQQDQQAAHRWLQKITEYQQQLADLTQQQQQLAVEYETSAAQRSQLALFQQAQALQTPLAHWQAAEQALKLKQAQVQTAAEKLPQLETAITVAEQAEQDAQQQQQHAADTLDAQLPILEQTRQQDRRIAERRQQLQHLQDSLQTQQTELTTVSNAQTEQNAVCQQLQASYETVQTWLTQHHTDQQLGGELVWLQAQIAEYHQLHTEQIQQAETVAALQQTLDATQQEFNAQQSRQQVAATTAQQQATALTTQQQQVQATLGDNTLSQWEQAQAQALADSTRLEKAYALAQNAEKVRVKQAECAAQQTQQQQQQQRLQHTVQQAEAELNQAQALLEQTEKVYALSLQIKDLTQHRTHLTDGEPCPLCGATRHPFQQEAAALPTVETEKAAVTAQKKQVKRAEKAKSAQEKQLTQVETDLQHNEKRTIELQQQLEELAQTLTALSPDLLSHWHTPDVLQQQHAAFQHTLHTVGERLHNIREQQASCEQLSQAAHEAQRTAEQAQAEVERLSLSLGYHQQQVEAQTQQATRLTEQLQRKTEYLTEQLSRYAVTLATPELLAQLQQRWDEWQTQQQQLEQTQSQLAEAKRDLTQLDTEVNAQQKRVTELAHQCECEEKTLATLTAERRGLLGEQDPEQVQLTLSAQLKTCASALQHAEQALQETRQAYQQQAFHLKALETECDTLQQQFTAQDSALQQQLSAQGFTDLAALQAALLPAETVAELQAQQDRLQQQQAICASQQQQLQQQLAQEQAKALTDTPLATLAAEIAQLIERQDILNREQGKIEHQLMQQQSQLQRYGELQTRYQQQQLEHGRWRLLNELIGSANGDKFRKFAQNLTLIRLVQLANQYLQQLNSRYVIQMDEQTDMTLKIQDTFQADHIRSMNTLSGGETFLVSLALALGLSDLAGAKTRIESLFIDEGFGTLDAETLDTAIVALENLHTLGKSVGIISHVTALKERIMTQVQIVRKSGGRSTVRVVTS